MKKYILILTLGLFAAAFAQTIPPEVKSAPVPLATTGLKVDPTVALTKERDDLKAQNATLAAQLAQTQQSLQYQTVLAERNELAIRVVQNSLNEWQARAQQLQAEINAEQAKTAKPPAPAK